MKFLTLLSIVAFKIWLVNPCIAKPSSSTLNLPPATQEVYDGTGGKFLIYRYGNAVRLQHVDESGDVWATSKLLIETTQPEALHRFDKSGKVWILSYDTEQSAENRTAWVQCFDRMGNPALPMESITLQLDGTPDMKTDDKGGINITTDHQEIYIDAYGQLSIQQAPQAVVPVSYSQEQHLAAVDPIPFQFAQGSNAIEVTTFIDADEIKEVVIRLEDASGRSVYEFSGFLGNDYHSWLIPTNQLSQGRYFLTLRTGEREQVEEVRI